MRRRMLLILALVIFVVAGVVYILLQGFPGTQKPTPTPELSPYTIIFVAQDIPAGSTITADSLVEGPWPRDMPLPGLVTDMSAVVGKRARIDLRRGEPIFSSQVVESGAAVSDTASATALKITPGKVAIAVPMNRLTGVAYAIGNGDHIMIIASMRFISLDKEFQTEMPNNVLLVGIDSEGKITFTQIQSGKIFKESPLSDILLATYYTPIEPQRPRLVSAVIVSDARVLSVGTVSRPVAAATPAAGGGAAAAVPSSTPDILVIEVTPDEALAVNFVMRLYADLTYALRSAGDTSVISVESMDLERLMTDFKIELPNTLSYGTVPRIENPFSYLLGNDVEAR